MSEILLPMFSSKIFVASYLIFKSLIPFEFILVCGIRRWSSLIFLHVSVQFSHHHLLNKLSFTHSMCLLLLSNIASKGVGLFLGSLLYSLGLCVRLPFFNCLFLSSVSTSHAHLGCRPCCFLSFSSFLPTPACSFLEFAD